MVILRNLRDMYVQTAVDANTSLNVCTDTIQGGEWTELLAYNTEGV